MKKFYLLTIAMMLSLSLMATVRYVSITGDENNNGLSWTTAMASIQSAIDASSSGDTVKVAQGLYNESVSVKNGVNLLGGYHATTHVRDYDAFETVIDGTDLGKWIIVKYDNACTVPVLIEGFTMQNAEHSSEGGAGYIRGNMTVSHCYVHHCSGSNGGAFMVDGAAVIQDCVIELCSATSSGGAIRNKGGVIERCLIRGCEGKYGTIRNDAGTVRNCVIHNCSATVSGWPNSGGIYNPGGNVINCTLANNYGEQYAGIHSESKVVNTVCWGNKAPDGFSDHVNYIAANASGAGFNAADDRSSSAKFPVLLSKNNTDATGPHFVSPTTFVGIPTNDAQIAAMRAADFSLLASSALINKGSDTDAPAEDINGVARPKGTQSDIGAYEYDPNAQSVAVTGVTIAPDTLTIYPGTTGMLTAVFTPRNATNRNLTWTSLNTAIASVSTAGVVTGVALGTARVKVVTQDGGFADTAVICVVKEPEVIVHPLVRLADSLYHIGDYTVPSYIPLWVAKEAARKDSSQTNIQALQQAIDNLVGKEEPYCMIANINGDPTTNMAFCWFTNDSITQGEVQLVAMADATETDFVSPIVIPATPTTTKALNYAVSTSGIIKATGMPSKQKFTYVSHKALATDLTPGTTYSYRVGYAGHWSDIATFHTAAEAPDTVSFVYMSDAHIMDQEYVDNARWCATAVAKHEADADFCVFPGDFVETGTSYNSEWEWEQWFETSIKPTIMAMPIVPTDGNHDDTNNLNYNYHFHTDWSFNQRSLKVKPQFSGITYSFMYGDILFLVYSMQDYWRGAYNYSAGTCTYLTTDVGLWFREQCAAHPEAKLRIALVHKNVFSGSGHQEDEETPMFRATMLPIFKDCEIDLALQGHDHCYEVMGPVNPDTRKPILSAISGVETVEVNTNTNMTGKMGGTFTVDEGTLYFIGATCGRKRYYPYTRAEMDAQKSVTKMENYFDLFTSRFGQPGAPSYTRFNVSGQTISAKTYATDANGDTTLFNAITIQRTRPHTLPQGWEDITIQPTTQDGVKYLRDGQLLIERNGEWYNAMGAKVE